MSTPINNFNSFLKNNRWFFSAYLLWFFYHLIIYLLNYNKGNLSLFWHPFLYYFWEKYDIYDISEFVIYLVAPLICWSIYKLVIKR